MYYAHGSIAKHAAGFCLSTGRKFSKCFVKETFTYKFVFITPSTIFYRRLLSFASSRKLNNLDPLKSNWLCFEIKKNKIMRARKCRGSLAGDSEIWSKCKNLLISLEAIPNPLGLLSCYLDRTQPGLFLVILERRTKRENNERLHCCMLVGPYGWMIEVLFLIPLTG